uniref:WG repeat-containing protein n=1 Tax=Castellaniella defragrans TaxID=75697 RepID=UPI0033426921
MNESKIISVFMLSLVVMSCALAQSQDRGEHSLIQGHEGWVYVDRDNRPILRPYIFDNGPDYFEEGLARFVENGKMGFHDEALNIVIPAQYDFVFPFSGGKARAGMNCRTLAQGEHSSVECEEWTTISKPRESNL